MDLMGKAIAPDNLAEERVLKAFQDGEKEVIVHPDGISSHLPSPERFTEDHIPALVATVKKPTAGDWQGEDVVIRASFLRSLFLGDDDRFATRSVVISYAQIEGRLDLNYCESRFPLNFFWCIFPEGISLQAATIPKLALTKCLIGQADQSFQLYAPQVKVTTNVELTNQFKAFGEVNLVGANIGGRFVCDGGHFKKGLKALHLKTGEDVFLGEGFNSNGEVLLNGANIGRQLVCTGGYFKKGLKAQNLKTGEDVHMREGFESYGEVNLLGADIGGQLACVGVHLEKGLKAPHLKTKGDVFLSGVVNSNGEVALFKSSGEVNLSGADIGGQLACNGGDFEKGLRALNLRAGAGVFLGGTFKSSNEVALINSNGELDRVKFSGELPTFKFDGEVILDGADIVGQLACIGCHLEKGLKAQHLKTGEDVFLIEGFNSNGEVALNGANIGGQFVCVSGHFKKSLKAYNLKAGEDVLLSEGFESNADVDLSGAIIGGQLSCAGGKFEQGLIADGLRYQEIDLGEDWEKVLTWLRKKIKMRKSGLQPYEQLMTVYRRMGKPDWARRVGFELEKKRHERSKSGWSAWYSILNWTIGYGYKPFTSLWLAIGLPLFGAVLFSDCTQNLFIDRTQNSSSKSISSKSVPAFLVNEWIPSEGEALKHWEETGQAPRDYPEFNPLIYSLESAFPVLPLGQLDKWHPSNTLFRWMRWIWTVIGSGLLAILALFGVGFLGPNRKSEGDSG